MATNTTIIEKYVRMDTPRTINGCEYTHLNFSLFYSGNRKSYLASVHPAVKGGYGFSIDFLVNGNGSAYVHPVTRRSAKHDEQVRTSAEALLTAIASAWQNEDDEKVKELLRAI